MAWSSISPRTAGPVVLAALLLLTTTLAAAQSEGLRYEAFPVERAFRSPVADPAAPRVYLSRINVSREAGKFQGAGAGIGYTLGLLRVGGERPDDGWQLGVFGSIDSIFDLDLPGDALVNTDYRIGLPLAWRHGAFSARGRVYHQSSHLGDELILGGNAPPRINLSFQAVDLLVAWEYEGLRLYGGGSHVIASSTDLYRGNGGQAGFDYVSSSSILPYTRLTGGVDVKWLEATDWRKGASVKAGVMLGRFTPDRRGFTVLAEYYDGFAPFGQFFMEDLRYYGVAVQFDF
jgi:hypothetical protein